MTKIRLVPEADLGNVASPAGTLVKGLMESVRADPASAFAIGQNATFAAGASRLMSVMSRGQEDASLVLLGDSTGNENTEWFYLLLGMIGGQFPAWTIEYRVWDDTGQAYPAAVDIQTGTGPRTLAVYNGSMPGASHEYPTGSPTRFAAMAPGVPTTVILSFGYNWGTADYRDGILTVAKWVLAYHPKAEIVAVAQPPKATADPDNPNSITRSRDVRDVAISSGFGVIDAAQAFFDYGIYDELIAGDYVHPLPAGSLLWAQEAFRHFNPATPRPQQSTPRPGLDRIMIPANVFYASLGAPAMGVPLNGIPAFVFGQTSLEIIATLVDIPPQWASVNVYLMWATDGASSGAVVLSVDYSPLTAGIALPLSGTSTPGAVAFTNAQQTLTAIAGQQMRMNAMIAKTAFKTGSPYALRIRRVGNDAADTYAGAMRVYGIIIERAE